MSEEGSIPACRQCGYLLRGLALRGNCPECGADYNLNLMQDASVTGVAVPVMNASVLHWWFYWSTLGAVLIAMMLLTPWFAWLLGPGWVVLAVLAWLASFWLLVSAVMASAYLWFYIAGVYRYLCDETEAAAGRITGLILLVLWYGLMVAIQWVYLAWAILPVVSWLIGWP
ncbi:hypothetical protein [Mucisphaera calidilacus]|uniref:Uncharacterized protein n=1 Tax=Mucisphaera calidilacus TaxID=2527982 RepID=A0A518BYU0_9BACT|nr:hypothetical protein [Mucisphaera calidilacus]QDU72124.1 hypothetical protein Pan265_19860 [Mucisphaera calidilacus]